MPARPVMEDLICLYQLLPPELAETAEYAWLIDQCFDIVQLRWARDEGGIYLDVMLEKLSEQDLLAVAQYRLAAARPE